jgi:hypothetical protein
MLRCIIQLRMVPVTKSILYLTQYSSRRLVYNTASYGSAIPKDYICLYSTF